MCCSVTEVLKLPRGWQARIRGIAAERPGPDAASEEGCQRGIVLGDPFQCYLDGAGYVDPGSLGSRGRPPITAAQADRP